MAVDDAKVVDFVVVETATGRVVLTIVDHLDWSDADFHLELLQAKINGYLSFVESGEIARKYPDSAGRRACIRIMAKHDLPDRGRSAFDDARNAVAQGGFDLEWQRLPPGDD